MHPGDGHPGALVTHTRAAVQGTTPARPRAGSLLLIRGAVNVVNPDPRWIQHGSEPDPPRITRTRARARTRLPLSG